YYPHWKYASLSSSRRVLLELRFRFMLSQHSTILDLCKGPLFARMSIPLRSTDREVVSCTDHQEHESAVAGACRLVLLGGNPKLSPGNCSADAQRIPDKPARRQ